MIIEKPFKKWIINLIFSGNWFSIFVCFSKFAVGSFAITKSYCSPVIPKYNSNMRVGKGHKLSSSYWSVPQMYQVDLMYQFNATRSASRSGIYRSYVYLLQYYTPSYPKKICFLFTLGPWIKWGWSKQRGLGFIFKSY